MNKQKTFYTNSDIIQAVLHFGLATAITLGVGYVIGPTLFIASALTSAAGIALLRAVVNDELSNGGKLLPLNSRISPYLGNMVQELSAKIGLKTPPPVYDFADMEPEPSGNVSERQKRRQKIRRLIKQTLVNAGVIDLGKPMLMVSTPLLQLLNDREEHGVLAHEFSHLGALHSKLRLTMAGIMGTAIVGAGLFALTTYLAVGLVPIALAIGTGIGLSLLKNRYWPAPEKAEPTDREILIEQLTGKKKKPGLIPYIGFGVLAAFAPIPVLTAFALTKATRFTNKLLLASYSRRNEFQTDRNAVTELGGDPLALNTALRKLEAVVKRDYPEVAALQNYKEGPVVTRLWKRARTLLRSHPNVSRRSRALGRLAKRHGYNRQAINQALFAPVDISALPPDPRLAAMSGQMLKL